MPNESEKHSVDELTQTLRKALIESGAIIPVTPEEVELAERHLTGGVTSRDVDAAFIKLEKSLQNLSPVSFMQLEETIAIPIKNDFAMAARNGEELDAETMAKIENTVNQIIGKSKPPQA